MPTKRRKSVERNKRILIVDDDPGIRESYAGILAPAPTIEILAKGESLFGAESVKPGAIHRETYDLTLVDRGDRGVKEVEDALRRKRPFSVAFIDMKMQGIDGAETAKRIWAIDSRVKVVIITAYSEYSPDDIIHATGRDDILYLRKPFNSEEIRQFAKALTVQWSLEQEREQLTSQLRKAIEELAEVNKNLQKRVEEQTSLLIQSEKMASIGILAAGVAHEINNPISFITGNLSTLDKYTGRITDVLHKYQELVSSLAKGEKSKIPSLLDAVRVLEESSKIGLILKDMVNLVKESMDGANRIANIVGDLKTFSRVDHAEIKAIDLNKAMDAAIHIVWNELKYKVDIVKEYGEIPEVKCFPQKLSQVFMNILMNAVQAIEIKGAIRIKTKYVEEGRRADDRFVEISISDTGRGIAKKDLSKIFDPFFTTKPPGQGTGLGLSIAYDIVAGHGGKIMVESEVGAGTTFTIRLPLEAKT
jgi:two-component system NtrC family sensor kinase